MKVIDLSAREIAAAIAAGELSSAEAVDACITRIESVHEQLNAVVATRFDAARAEAADADRRRAAGARVDVRTPPDAGLGERLVFAMHAADTLGQRPGPVNSMSVQASSSAPGGTHTSILARFPFRSVM